MENGQLKIQNENLLTINNFEKQRSSFLQTELEMQHIKNLQSDKTAFMESQINEHSSIFKALELNIETPVMNNGFA